MTQAIQFLLMCNMRSPGWDQERANVWFEHKKGWYKPRGVEQTIEKVIYENTTRLAIYSKLRQKVKWQRPCSHQEHYSPKQWRDIAAQGNRRNSRGIDCQRDGYKWDTKPNRVVFETPQRDRKEAQKCENRIEKTGTLLVTRKLCEIEFLTSLVRDGDKTSSFLFLICSSLLFYCFLSIFFCS